MLSLCRQTDGRTDRLTTVKQYAPDLSMWGHKNLAITHQSVSCTESHSSGSDTRGNHISKEPTYTNESHTKKAHTVKEITHQSVSCTESHSSGSDTPGNHISKKLTHPSESHTKKAHTVKRITHQSVSCTESHSKVPQIHQVITYQKSSHTQVH